MSARAAARLDQLGVPGPVYRYAGGKVDWLASGLPTEGDKPEKTPIGALARRDVATCAADASCESALSRLRAQDTQCVVVDERRTVLGVIDRSALEAGAGAAVATCMDVDPATVRYHQPSAAIRERMEKKGLRSILVTNPEGMLLGVFEEAREKR